MVLGRRKNTQGWNDKVTNELFMLKKVVDEEPQPGNGESADTLHERFLWHSKVFSVFLGSLERFERPSILDLGPVTNQNISYYGELGWKVHAHDILEEYGEAVKRAKAMPRVEIDEDNAPSNPIEEILDEWNHEPGSLHGVLCWDVLDRLPLVWTRELVRRVALALDENGVILSIFGAKSRATEKEPHRGFRIRDEKNLEPIMDNCPYLERFNYENGEIMSLFADFKVLNFYLMKNNFREILVQKQPQASLKVSA